MLINYKIANSRNRVPTNAHDAKTPIDFRLALDSNTLNNALAGVRRCFHEPAMRGVPAEGWKEEQIKQT